MTFAGRCNDFQVAAPQHCGRFIHIHLTPRWEQGMREMSRHTGEVVRFDEIVKLGVVNMENGALQFNLETPARTPVLGKAHRAQ